MSRRCPTCNGTGRVPENATSAATTHVTVESLRERCAAAGHHVSGDGARVTEQAAEFLIDVAAGLLRKRRGEGRHVLPFVKISGRYFYRLSDIANLLAGTV